MMKKHSVSYGHSNWHSLSCDFGFVKMYTMDKFVDAESFIVLLIMFPSDVHG